MKATYNLPFPVSVNCMFRNVKGRGRVKTKEYRAWLNEAGLYLIAQPKTKFETQVEISIDLDERRKGDADNRFKAISDLLVHHGIIADDSQPYVRRISIGWAPVDGCVVNIVACTSPRSL